MAGCCLKVGIDLESLDLDGGNDLAGFDNSLHGFEHAVVCGSCTFSDCKLFPKFLCLSTMCQLVPLCVRFDSVTSADLVGLCV